MNFIEFLLRNEENLYVLTANHPDRREGLLANRLLEYGFLRIRGNLAPWLVTGRVVGRGGDREPVLEDVQVLGRVSKKAIEEAMTRRIP